MDQIEEIVDDSGELKTLIHPAKVNKTIYYYTTINHATPCTDKHLTFYQKQTAMSLTHTCKINGLTKTTPSYTETDIYFTFHQKNFSHMKTTIFQTGPQ